MDIFVCYLADRSGATSIEYGLIAFLIGLAGILAFAALGAGVSGTFLGVQEDFCDAVNTVANICESSE